MTTTNCTLPDGVIHMHSERCYQGGRADALREADRSNAMIRPERNLSLAPAPVTVVEANGKVYLNRGGQSIEIPQAEIPRVASELLVSMERISDATSEPWT